MADKKISALTPSTTPLTGVEVLPIVQSGSTVKVSVADLTAGRAVAATSVTTGLGAVGTPAYTFTGDTNTGIYSPTADTIAFVEGGVEAMRIDASGNVGIGTSSPGSKLDVVGGSSTGGVTVGGSVASVRASSTVIDLGDSNRFMAVGANTTTAGTMKFIVASSDASVYTTAAIIDTSGNVGIGAAPLSFTPLYIYRSGSDAGLRAERASGAALDMFATASSAYFGTANSYPIFFQTNGTERARIDSSGNLLVGKSTLSSVTVGASIEPGGTISSTRSGSTGAASTLEVYSTGAGAYRFYVDMAGTVFATSTTISAISDIRFKENVRDLDAGLDTILALKPRRFDWKEGKGKDVKDDMGFIAQEVEEVLPALIDGWKAGEGEPDDLKSVKAGDLIPVLVKAIQELTARVAQLEGK